MLTQDHHPSLTRRSRCKHAEHRTPRPASSPLCYDVCAWMYAHSTSPPGHRLWTYCQGQCLFLPSGPGHSQPLPLDPSAHGLRSSSRLQPLKQRSRLLCPLQDGRAGHEPRFRMTRGDSSRELPVQATTSPPILSLYPPGSKIGLCPGSLDLGFFYVISYTGPLCSVDQSETRPKRESRGRELNTPHAARFARPIGMPWLGPGPRSKQLPGGPATARVRCDDSRSAMLRTTPWLHQKRCLLTDGIPDP